MATTHTDKRIRKLAQKGLTPEQIARKIGRPKDIDRVLIALGEDPFWRQVEKNDEADK